MMTMTKLRFVLLSLFVGAALAPVVVSAAGVGAALGASAQVQAAGVSASTTISATAMANAKTRADQEIDRRTASLTALNARVGAMQAVTAAFKQTLATNIQTVLGDLATLKAKIDADTDGATLKADVQSITKSYRVYMLVLPQSRIAAQADREVTIVSMMTTLGGKLQGLITAAGNNGANISAMTTALADLSAKLQDGSTQAQAAVTATASLTPDNGDKTVEASNTAALKTARTDLQKGQQDLVAARKDIQTILTGLKSVHAGASASSTTQVQTQ